MNGNEKCIMMMGEMINKTMKSIQDIINRLKNNSFNILGCTYTPDKYLDAIHKLKTINEINLYRQYLIEFMNFTVNQITMITGNVNFIIRGINECIGIENIPSEMGIQIKILRELIHTINDLYSNFNTFMNDELITALNQLEQEIIDQNDI